MRLRSRCFLMYQFFAILTFLMVTPVAASAIFPTSSEPAETEIVVPDDLNPDQVGEFVAPLSEQQVRSLLINNLEQTARSNAVRNDDQPISVFAMLGSAGDPDSELGTGIRNMLIATQTFEQEVSQILATFTPGAAYSGFIILIGYLVVAMVFGFAAEWFFQKRQRQRRISETSASNTSSGSPLSTLLLNLCGLLIFSIISYVVLLTLVPDNEIQISVVMHFYGAVLFYRLLTIFFKLAVYPPNQGLGLIDSRINRVVLYRCLAAFAFSYIFGTEFVLLLVTHGLPIEHMILSFMFLFGLVVNPIVFWFVWTQREDIDRIMFGSMNENELRASPYAFASRAKIWPSVVTFVVFLAFLNWQLQALTGNTQRMAAIELAWWIALLFPLVDLLVSSLLYRLVSLNIFQSEGFRRRRRRVTYVIRSVIRFVLLTLFVVSFLEAWGFRPIERLSSAGGISILSSIIDIGVTILLGFIIWEAVQLSMERHMPDDDGPAAEIEGEGGGAAATRTETLLPLFRTILLVILSVIVVMSVLYSLGVQIGPLLAGASVVGIAIGFGSQKLVQDIISGMFFLIDDAFRRGEYVEVAGLRGTIEKLSVRSMRLRHHLGSVQTIPYGEISTVKNTSRDWVIMKLEIRLPYDVDIEKVRKIIKKVGQGMIADEETGPMMLQPLKSQGVMRVEESALIVRMKFTAKPGEQWVVRRVAYTKVRDALSAAGIEFAHREIKVRMPTEMEAPQLSADEKTKETLPTVADKKDNAEALAAGAVSAAALSAVVANELTKHEKIEDGGDDMM